MRDPAKMTTTKNVKHIDILRQGVSVWNAWREENLTVRPDLSGVNLREVNLREVNLRWADLQGADLRLTNLRGADLRRADLGGANLRGAYLQGADLRGADLCRADGDFLTFRAPRGHDAIAAGGYASIGCEHHSFSEWLKRGKEIGKENGYSDELIALYRQFVEMAISVLGEEANDE